MSTSLRPSEPRDVAAVTAIYAHYVLTHTATFELEPPGADEMARRRRDIVEAKLPWWVACDGDEVLGYCYAAPYRARPAYRYTLEDSIYLAPTHVGRGVGKALIRYGAHLAVERGCGRYEWSVLDWNEPAIDFYRSIGAIVLPDWRICRMGGDVLARFAASSAA